MARNRSARIIEWPMPDNLDMNHHCEKLGWVGDGEDRVRSGTVVCVRKPDHQGPHYDHVDKLYWEFTDE